MIDITSAEASRNFSHLRERAAHEPVIVMHYNKASVVVVSAAEYDRLKRRDRQVLAVEDIPDWLAELVINGEMDARHDQLDGVKAPKHDAAAP